MVTGRQECLRRSLPGVWKGIRSLLEEKARSWNRWISLLGRFKAYCQLYRKLPLSLPPVIFIPVVFSYLIGGKNWVLIYLSKKKFHEEHCTTQNVTVSVHLAKDMKFQKGIAPDKSLLQSLLDLWLKEVCMLGSCAIGKAPCMASHLSKPAFIGSFSFSSPPHYSVRHVHLHGYIALSCGEPDLQALCMILILKC